MAWKIKVGALYNLRKYEDALKANNYALNLSPQNEELLNIKRATLAELGRYEEAEAYLIE